MMLHGSSPIGQRRGAAMNRRLAVILLTIVLNSAGVGLIMPVLPGLFREFTVEEHVPLLFGAMLALFALMQFVFAPAVGALSDRFGRRPVLLLGLAVAAADYLVMTFSPWLWLIFVGRAIAGIAAAELTVAFAYLTDVSSPEDRPRRFGYAHACLGAGFVLGPAAGGLLGEVWLRGPFLAAAGLSALAFVLAALWLEESRPAESDEFAWNDVNPLTPVRWALGFRFLLPILAIFAAIRLVNQSYGTVMVLFSEDRFGWSSSTVGLLLAVFGVSQLLIMSLVPGPLTRWLGERAAVMVGIACELAALVVLSVTTSTLMAFLLAPMFAMSGVAIPGLQSLATSRTEPDHQGRLQGVITSTGSLMAIVGPLAFGAIYAATHLGWNGVVWLVDAAVYLALAPLLAAIPARATRQEDDDQAGRGNGGLARKPR